MVEGKLIGKAAVGLQIIQMPDGKTGWKLDYVNDKVPVELFLMQIKAFVRNLENEYFDNFDKTFTKLDKGQGEE